MPVLKREEILAAKKLRQEIVAMPEWGGEVIVQEFSAHQRDQFEAMTVEMRGKNIETNLENFRAKLAAASIVDEAGNPLFSAVDVHELGKLSARALQRIVDVATRLNALSVTDIDELVKN